MSELIPSTTTVVASAPIPIPVPTPRSTRQRRGVVALPRGPEGDSGEAARRSPSPLQQIKVGLSVGNRPHSIPWLAHLHKVADGVLLTSIGSAAILCALVLNLQIKWSGSYSELEEAQQLRQQLVEVTTALRASLRSRAQGSDGLSTTQSEDLMFMEPPPVRLPVNPFPSPPRPLVHYDMFLRGY